MPRINLSIMDALCFDEDGSVYEEFCLFMVQFRVACAFDGSKCRGGHRREIRTSSVPCAS